MGQPQGGEAVTRNPLKDPRPGDVLRCKFAQVHVIHPLGPGETRDMRLWAHWVRRDKVEVWTRAEEREVGK